jgi:hypothetical protein
LSAEAILLAPGDRLSSQDGNLAKLLDFFGVSWRAATAAQLLGDNNINQSGLRVLGSSDHFATLISELERNCDRARQWREQIHSVFVYAGDDVTTLASLAAISAEKSNCSVVVSDQLPEFCGIMSGVRIAADISDGELTFASPSGSPNVEIISTAGGACFIRFEYRGVPVFLCSSGRIIDVEAELPDGIFDIRAHVFEALPPVLYIRWAFVNASWRAPESSACLIIDDPLLKPRYGFLEYSELLSLMRRYKFSTNIAFIPWNWRRSDSSIARLIRENPEYYSISVHGCAHTRAEFGVDDSDRLYGKARKALEQMRRHESVTGIAHDRVMVFPQGVFSEAAMSVLKRTDLIAAVNNDTVSSNCNPRAIKVADVWDTAIMAYGNFPLFTRRYPWSGVENFAFDNLLGKPILIVVHHDFCRDHCVRLIDFMERLNALGRPLAWRSLGEVVRRNCRQRVLSADLTQVEMYAKELYLENTSEQTKHFLIGRRESDPSSIREIRAGSKSISWNFRDGKIQFEVELKGRETVTIRLNYRELGDAKTVTENLNDRARTMLRRYLCELRDNYLHKLTSLSSNGK